MLIALAVMGCAQSSVYVTKGDCSRLVPDAWRDGVQSAAAPVEASDDLEKLKAWVNFGLAQTGNLVIANSRTTDALGIIERCEQRDREAIEKAKPKFLGLF